ncbi:hypothetical protein Pam2_89 [Pseudanabaena phage Pam2]|nr:hypothetical protein Pam2_89 [Pseudanabaena phage Pam2]
MIRQFLRLFPYVRQLEDQLRQAICGEISLESFQVKDDVPYETLKEIERLKPKVDEVVALLTFLFLQGSESQQIDMFERFLAANLGKGKIVHFWSE